jgi:hypothetical protein
MHFASASRARYTGPLDGIEAPADSFAAVVVEGEDEAAVLAALLEEGVEEPHAARARALLTRRVIAAWRAVEDLGWGISGDSCG